MFTLFLRAIILYMLIFLVLRISGKRQISDLQPFDLMTTLLAADLATNPIQDPSVPLVYGVIPILTLLFIQLLMAYLSMKSERVRALACGKAVIIIDRGIIQEDVMRRTSYTLNDLLEQLRTKDVFDPADVAYAILETNGSISVMLKGSKHKPTLEDCSLPEHETELNHMFILDGKVHERALQTKGYNIAWLMHQLQKAGCTNAKDVFFASLAPDGTLQIQTKQKCGSQLRFVQTRENGNG